ncbi:MAG: sensor histidine kinase [Rhodopila sp.]
MLPLVEHELAACDIMLDVALAPGDPRVNGDQEQLQQVLLNLVVNAIQAMEQTADRPRVLSIRSDLGAIDSAAPCAMIKASDIGPGIEAGPMSRLFAPFYTTKPQGMGMGLSACRSIVQAHGGIIDAVRGRASGAAFTMAIPIYVRAKVPARRRQSITLWQRTKVATA